MGKTFVNLGMSLDGYIAGPNARPGNPLGDGGPLIHTWMYRTATFQQRLNIGGHGSTGPDDDLVRYTFDRTGAYIMGRRMFDEGEVGWPEDPPFGTPVYVLTDHAREPWVRGRTTFTFVTDGIESALAQAKAAAGAKDVRIAGGADTVRRYLAAGLVDELTISLAPMLLGRGVRLFDESVADVRLRAAQPVTHHTFDIAE